MSMKIFATSSGLVTSLGGCVESNIQGIVRGESGVALSNCIDGVERHVLFGQANVDEQTHRLYALAHKALLECVNKSELSQDELSRTAFIFAYGAPNSGLLEQEFDFFAHKGKTRPRALLQTMTNYVASQLALDFNLKAEVCTNASACTGSAMSLHLGRALIKAGLVDRCICGGAEIVTKFGYVGFDSMRVVLARGQPKSALAIQPFGADRSGIALGEAAGFMLLESEESCTKRKANTLMEFEYSNNKNYASAMYGNFTKEQWEEQFSSIDDPSSIDLVIAHGTSTVKGDLTEGQAIQDFFPNIPVVATKHYVGHTLSASTIVDTILLADMLQKNTLFGAGHRYQLDDSLAELNLVFKQTPAKIHRAIKLSAGFGGGIACQTFKS